MIPDMKRIENNPKNDLETFATGINWIHHPNSKECE